MRSIDQEQVKNLLTCTHLMDDKEAALGHDLIKADALSFSKWMAALVAAGGGLATVAPGVAAWATNPDHLDLAITLLAVMGAVLIATIAAMAWIVTNDVKMRAATQQARYRARASVVDDYFTFLDDSNKINPVENVFR